MATPAAETATETPTVLYEDNHLLVLAKPHGMLSQGDRTGDPSILDWGKGYLKRAYGKPGNVFLGLVHRLDRPAGGVMVFARTSKAASRLSDAIRRRRVGKVYWALCETPPDAPEGRLEDGLVPGRGRKPSRVVPMGTEGSQAARLAYRVVAELPLGTLVEVVLETGRKHQIRAQLAHAGAPILGDARYGAKRPWRPGAIALHARSLTLPHPTRDEELTIAAAPPADWEVPAAVAGSGEPAEVQA